MDPASLDPSHGTSFSNEVCSIFGLLVCSQTPDDASRFWLVVAFSRSRFRLTEESVGLILQSVLGGSAKLFSVVGIEDQIFKLTVLNRRVGLHVYALKSHSCEFFRLFFHLWNENGLSKARIAARIDSGPSFDWVHPKSKKSFAEAVISGASSSKSVFSRLNFRHVPDQFLSNRGPCSSRLPPNQSPSFSPAFLRNSNSNSKGGSAGPSFLSGANAVPLGFKWVQKRQMGRPMCTRCFSNQHSRPDCRSRVRYSSCFWLGHLAISCQFPPRFPGLVYPGSFLPISRIQLGI